MSDDPIREVDEHFISSLPQDYADSVRARVKDLILFSDMGVLPISTYQGAKALDWEAGNGAFAVAMLFLGAKEVLAIDSWATPDALPEGVRRLKSMRFLKASLAYWITGAGSSERNSFGFAFSNTVTEHITDLPDAFDAIHKLLSHDGKYFNNHDNYYSPCGSHDHGFWFYGSENLIEYQGIRCWEKQAKCAESRAHRERVQSIMPWTWSSSDDEALTPDNCATCRYFKRSQPWAHLQFVDDFINTFPRQSFLTMRPTSSLNKVTPFQLHQFINEAKFEILETRKNFTGNVPLPSLLERGLSGIDLTTTTIMTLVRPVEVS